MTVDFSNTGKVFCCTFFISSSYLLYIHVDSHVTRVFCSLVLYSPFTSKDWCMVFLFHIMIFILGTNYIDMV
jgi:hypothetical protein